MDINVHENVGYSPFLVKYYGTLEEEAYIFIQIYLATMYQFITVIILNFS